MDCYTNIKANGTQSIFFFAFFFSFGQEGSTKQVNLLATPQDRSLKVITASIQDLLRWKQVEDKMCVIYEVFGEKAIFHF